MPAIHGITGTPWSYCDRCGWSFRLSDLTMQNGLLLDRACLDAPLMFKRDRMVAEAIAPDGTVEADNATAQKRADDPNIVRE